MNHQNTIIVPRRGGDHFRTQARWALMGVLADACGVDIHKVFAAPTVLSLEDVWFIMACETIAKSSTK